MKRVRGLGLAFMTGGALVLGAVRADAEAFGPKGPSQAALTEGKKLMAQHQFHRACPKIAEAQKLYPLPTTLLQLALCHEQAGMTGTAYEEFETLVEQTKSTDPTGKAARSHADNLGAKLSHLTIRVATEAVNAGVDVTLDGQPVSPSSFGRPKAVDPGNHEVAARSKTGGHWAVTVGVNAEHDEKTVEVPAVVDEEHTPIALAKKEATLEHPDYGEPPPEAKKEVQAPARNKFGYFVAATGVVSIAIGTIYGLDAVSKRKDSDGKCKPVCNQEGVSLNEQAKIDAWVSNFGIGLGLAAVVGGAYLAFSKPSEPPKSDDSPPPPVSLKVVPVLTAQTSGVVLRGAF